MAPRSSKLCTIISAIGAALSMAFSNAVAQPPTYDVVQPPACTNNKGEAVSFIASKKGRSHIASGMAIRDQSGKPVVYRSNYTVTPPDFQRFIDRHECAHHQTGDVDRPHPPRNGVAHLMNESISDCIAILRLRDEEGYNRAAFSKVANAMRVDMAKIGFPEISISSRISNIHNCYTRYGTPHDFIIGILKQRDLQ